ncbi:MAG: hypothetical protein CMH60_07210 [Myxococcales bacterium]|nr:hypothetical protein [Myxococcales bacterium]
MSRAVLFEDNTLVLWRGDKLVKVRQQDLAGALSEPTSIAVVGCEMTRVASASAAGLDKQTTGRLPPGSVYCYQHLDGPQFQVFSMPEDLLRDLRSVPMVSQVLPYGLAVRDGLQSKGGSTKVTQLITSAAQFSTQPDKSWAVCDLIGLNILLTIIVGNEIKAFRTISVDDPIEREVMLSLQSEGVTDAEIVSQDMALCERLRKADMLVRYIDLPTEAPNFGLYGLSFPPTTEFYLKEELVAARRRQLEKKSRKVTIVCGAIFAISLILWGALFFQKQGLDEKLGQINAESTRTEGQVRELFRERFANLPRNRKELNLPEAWGELLLLLPPQLELTEVTVNAKTWKAKLQRREGVLAPPLSVVELKRSMKQAKYWKNAKVLLDIQPHKIDYTLVKKRR